MSYDYRYQAYILHRVTAFGTQVGSGGHATGGAKTIHASIFRPGHLIDSGQGHTRYSGPTYDST